MSIPLIAVLCGAAATLILFAANIVTLVKTEQENRALTIASHAVGLVTAAGNLIRIIGVEFGPVIGANVVALICILISLRRVLKGETEQAAQNPEPTAQ